MIDSSRERIPTYKPMLIGKDTFLKVFTGRKDIIDDITDMLRRKIHQHLILVGPRGIGKTTLLTRILYIVLDDTVLENVWKPIIFKEDAYRNIFDLNTFIMMLRVGMEQNGIRFRDSASPDADENGFESFIRDLQEYHRDTGHHILLLLDNLHSIIRRLRKTEDLNRFRSLLYNEPYLMVIGTSLLNPGDIFDYEHPLFRLFDVRHLAPFTDDEVRQMVDRLIMISPAGDMPESNKEHIQNAIHQITFITNGYPRLVKILFDLMLVHRFENTFETLLTALDELSEYYSNRLDALSPEEERIVNYMMSKGMSMTTSDIARHFNRNIPEVYSIIVRLEDKGFIRVNRHVNRDRKRPGDRG